MFFMNITIKYSRATIFFGLVRIQVFKHFPQRFLQVIKRFGFLTEKGSRKTVFETTFWSNILPFSTKLPVVLRITLPKIFFYITFLLLQKCLIKFPHHYFCSNFFLRRKLICLFFLLQDVSLILIRVTKASSFPFLYRFVIFGFFFHLLKKCIASFPFFTDF